MMWFVSDEHMSHCNIIKYCMRPFSNVHEMNKAITDNFNSVVKANDITVHLGDFTLEPDPWKYIERLNGKHIFLKGSHDRWIKNYKRGKINLPPNVIDEWPNEVGVQLWEDTIDGIHVSACHYCLRVWPRSHYNSVFLYGHSHNKLAPIGRSLDVGVDSNNFFPFSWYTIKTIMNAKPNNFNYIGDKKDRCKHNGEPLEVLEE